MSELALEALRAWRVDPVRMVNDLFNVTPDAWQVDALRAWASPEQRVRIAMQACVGPGKSAVLAWQGWNGLLCYAEGERYPNGAAVSITQENLRNGLWKELSVWREKSPILTKAFEMTSERIFEREHPRTWYLDARSFAKSADPETMGSTLAGLHSEFIFYLVDETGSMPPSVLRSGEQGLSNCVWGRISQAGNPTNHTGALYQAATVQSHLWKIIRITGDPDDPKRSPRIALDWAREQIALYGRENPWVMANILGQFPPSSINALLGPDEVRNAMGKHLTIDQYEWSQKRLGVDVARFGDDRTVIFPRQGLASFRPVIMRQQRANPIAARVAMAKEKWGAEMITVDDSGTWGAGVIDNLVTAGHSPIGIPFGAPALDQRYKNRRAEMWIKMSEWVKRGGALPNIPEMVAELTEPTYTFDTTGKFMLEEKAQIKARVGRSPDLADALALTFALPDMPAGEFQGTALFGGNSHTTAHEWDPYANKEG